MKRIFVSLMVATLAIAGQAVMSNDASAAEMTSVAPRKQKAEIKTVTFSSDIQCENCAKKVRENISFEKGVKGLEVSVADKTIRITYDASKTDVEKLSAAVRKLGYSAKQI